MDRNRTGCTAGLLASHGPGLQQDITNLHEDGDFSVKERLQLQGLPDRIRNLCRGHVSDRQLGAETWNSLSLNVIKALLSKMLPACGLMP